MSDAPEATRPNLLFILPVIFVLGLFALFAVMLTSDRNPAKIRNIQIDQQAPALALPLLTGDRAPRLDDGRMTLVNFFASWCVPCRAEHDQLMDLAARADLRIIGVAYKDKPGDSLAFLDELGNPYVASVTDLSGLVAIDYGVTGAPESFLIDGKGIIRYHHWGPIIADAYTRELLPQIDALSAEMGLGK